MLAQEKSWICGNSVNLVVQTRADSSITNGLQYQAVTGE